MPARSSKPQERTACLSKSRTGRGLPRKEVTKRLTLAAAQYLAQKGYSCHPEVALKIWGKRRADILGLTLRGHVVLCEVKSCAADFQADSKWEKYLPFCNKMYFVVPYFMLNQKVGDSFVAAVKKHGVGIMVLTPKGTIKVLKAARSREVDPEVVNAMTVRLAWRGGAWSKRTLPRQLVAMNV